MLKGAGISGLSPKTLPLHFSLFPQFMDHAAGWPLAAQTGLFGTLHMARPFRLDHRADQGKMPAMWSPAR